MTTPVALTIAGSDSGGGAGIQADLKTFSAMGVYGASVITSLTAQNTLGVQAIFDVAPSFVSEQIRSVLSDFETHAIKTGMLSTPAIVETVADSLEQLAPQIPLVIDPVMISKSGHHLLQPEAVQTVVQRLFPLAALVTPNAYEAEMLTGMTPTSDKEAVDVARALLDNGPAAVLLKGGHRGNEGANDLFLDRQGNLEWLRAQRLDQRHTHGTGCTLSAAIAAAIACGADTLEACRRGKHYIQGAIGNAFAIGHGTGPVNHLWDKGGFSPRMED